VAIAEEQGRAPGPIPRCRLTPLGVEVAGIVLQARPLALRSRPADHVSLNDRFENPPMSPQDGQPLNFPQLGGDLLKLL